MSYRRIPLLAAVLWFVAAPMASAEDWTPQKIWVSGSDKSAWVVASGRAPDEKMPVIEMWYAGGKRTEAGFETPAQSASLEALVGEIDRIGADALVLRVLFSNLDSCNYAIKSSSLGGVLWRQQSDTAPLAWGGDASLGVFYAVALTSQLKEEKAEPTNLPESRPAEEAGESEEPQAVATPAAITSRATCLRFRDGRWERIACPPQSDVADQYWITGRNASPCLFWQASGGDVFCSMYEGNAWSAPEAIGAPKEFAFARVGMGEDGPVFVAAVSAGESRVNLHVFQRTANGWQDMSSAREGSELFVGDPAKIDVAIARNELAVARLSKDGKLEFGSGELGVSPPLAFDELRIRTPVSNTPGWQNIVFTVVVLTIVTLLFWARRELAVYPLALPPGWMLAGTWKRALAAAIDFIPASVLGAVLMSRYVPDMPQENMSAVFDKLGDPEFAARALPISIAVMGVYGLWCFAWELMTATTPGKRLFNCRVFMVDGSRPGIVAVALRNLMRSIILLSGEPGILVLLMTMVFLTRNRQRPGDLLARTLVLEPRRERFGFMGGDENNDRREPPRE